MMVPPVIRMGRPPYSSRSGVVVLLPNRGWCIAQWHPKGYLLDTDTDAVAMGTREIDPSDVLCWMPEDGS